MSAFRWTTLACGAGIAARIACVLAGPGAVRTDAIAYRAAAHALAEGHGFAALSGAANWMPGWPAWMALFYRVGLGDRAIVFGNALLSIATIALAGAIARELGRNARAAAAVTALVPSLATMPRLLVSENLVLPLFALATLLLVRAAKTGSLARWAAFGVAAALAVWVREACLALAFAGVVVALARRSIKSAAVVVAVMALALAPWVRTHPRLTRSDAVCIGLGDGATGGYRANVPSDCVIRPARLVTLAPAKLTRLFAYDDWTADDFFARRSPSAAFRVFCNISWWALAAAAVLGALLQRAGVLELAAVIAGGAVSAIVTFGAARFHAPIVPLLAVLACYRRRS